MGDRRGWSIVLVSLTLGFVPGVVAQDGDALPTPPAPESRSTSPALLMLLAGSLAGAVGGAWYYLGRKRAEESAQRASLEADRLGELRDLLATQLGLRASEVAERVSAISPEHNDRLAKIDVEIARAREEIAKRDVEFERVRERAAALSGPERAKALELVERQGRAPHPHRVAELRHEIGRMGIEAQRRVENEEQARRNAEDARRSEEANRRSQRERETSEVAARERERQSDEQRLDQARQMVAKRLKDILDAIKTVGASLGMRAEDAMGTPAPRTAEAALTRQAELSRTKAERDEDLSVIESRISALGDGREAATANAMLRDLGPSPHPTRVLDMKLRLDDLESAYFARKRASAFEEKVMEVRRFGWVELGIPEKDAFSGAEPTSLEMAAARLEVLQRQAKERDTALEKVLAKIAMLEDGPERESATKTQARLKHPAELAAVTAASLELDTLLAEQEKRLVREALHEFNEIVTQLPRTVALVYQIEDSRRVAPRDVLRARHLLSIARRAKEERLQAIEELKRRADDLWVRWEELEGRAKHGALLARAKMIAELDAARTGDNDAFARAGLLEEKTKRELDSWLKLMTMEQEFLIRRRNFTRQIEEGKMDGLAFKTAMEQLESEERASKRERASLRAKLFATLEFEPPPL